MDKSVDNNVFLDSTPVPTSVTFTNDGGEEVGRISIEKDGLKFTGKADKSARVFFDYFLKGIVDNYLKEKEDK